MVDYIRNTLGLVDVTLAHSEPGSVTGAAAKQGEEVQVWDGAAVKVLQQENC